MSSTPYMQFYVGDYIQKTLHLTTEQHGAYLLLLMALWNSGATMPMDHAKLARIVRVSPKRWPMVWAEIAPFFIVQDGQISQPRLTKEHQKVLSISQERKTAGSKGGTAKALKKHGGVVANATNLPDVCSSIPEPEPDLSKIEAKASRGGSPKSVRKPEVPIPPDWVVSDRNRSDAEDRQFSAQEITDEADRFHNHHIAKGSLFRDWDAAWRTWLGNARKYAQGGGMVGAAKTGGYGRRSSLASIAARRHAQG